MDYKKRVIIIIIILILILLFSSFLLINNNLINKTADNSTIKYNISKNISSDRVNISGNASDNSSNGNDSLCNHDSYQLSQDNSRHDKQSKVKSDEITEEDIRKAVIKGVVWEDSNGKDTQDVRIGKIFRFKNGYWLVPAFDKKTGKFLGAILVGPTGGFYGGVDSFSDYKKLISGKKINNNDDFNNDIQSGSSEDGSSDKNKKSSDFYVLAKSNSNYSDSSQPVGINVFTKLDSNSSADLNSVITDNQNDVCLDNVNINDCNSKNVIVDSENVVNSTI